MKYIITENQNKILWLKRRISQQHVLMRDIILKEFEYVEICSFNYPGGDQDFYEEIMRESAITFVDSFEELYKTENELYGVLLKMSYDYMAEKYRNEILDYFYSHVSDLCDEDELNENFNPYSLIPPDLKRRITPGDLKKMGEQLLELAHYTKEVTKDTYETKLMSLIHYIIRQLAMDKNSYNVSLETKDMYNKLYNYLRYVYEDEIKEIWNNSLK